MDLFKGYVLTKDKACLESFKGRDDLKSLNDVQKSPEFAGILGPDTILIDVDDLEMSDILFDMVKDLHLKCRVYQTTRGKHFLFRNSGVTNNSTGARLAVGLTADIKLGSRNSYSILRFKGVDRPILYDTPQAEIQDLPKWLYPIKTNTDFMTMEAGDGRNQALFNYILTLQSEDFTVEEARETIRMINDYVLIDPLSDREIDVILRDDAFKKPVFFKGSSFLFDKFATYLKNNSHICMIDGQLHIYKEGVYLPGLGPIEAQMIKHIPNLNRSKRSEVLAYLPLIVGDNIPQSSPNLIAFNNGVLDIFSGAFSEFSPDIVITNKINWPYNPNAYDELMDHTLNRLACDDPQVRALLEECIGYCMFRRNELGKAFILIGDKSNGKSTFLDMVKTMLGEYNIASLDLKELGDRFKTAEVAGKLANIGDDIGDEFIANASLFRKLVTGDRVNAERKGQDPFEFNNYSKFLFSANNIPRIKDKTGAVQRRLVIIPFDAKFSPDDADFRPYIKYELREQKRMEYLITLGISGLKRVLTNRQFTASEKVTFQLNEYEQANNPVLAFFDEIGENDILNEPTKKVYMRYKEFCLSNNFQAMSNIEFSRQLTRRFGYVVADKWVKSEGKCRVFVKEGST
ncbi:MAG: phage/plasmid primase, P4 family [Alphaproteobacteria bacterium]|nr:phage/plasmid primase, P4 family [Alphaproteobacteria bacterium]